MHYLRHASLSWSPWPSWLTVRHCIAQRDIAWTARFNPRNRTYVNFPDAIGQHRPVIYKSYSAGSSQENASHMIRVSGTPTRMKSVKR